MIKKLLYYNINDEKLVFYNLRQCLFYSLLYNILLIILQMNNLLPYMSWNMLYSTLASSLIIPFVFICRGLFIAIKQLKIDSIKHNNKIESFITTIVIIPLIGFFSVYMILISFIVISGGVA